MMVMFSSMLASAARYRPTGSGGILHMYQDFMPADRLLNAGVGAGMNLCTSAVWSRSLPSPTMGVYAASEHT